ncbi:hypothetical protein [Furfurilactobacillus milii]|uniref:hypothetical protein n=1 Tax=Furfurilactobacillus milii TaxID=2888272 RepID=UPI001F1AC23E|nr:hypothetical protein [Furfurilactobacillus milii]MCF6420614.1 hypothetical protein [Furfurilactobacillus milii]
MSNTTRWRISTGTFINLLGKLDTVDNDSLGDPTIRNLDVQKVFNDDPEETFNNTVVHFNYFNISYEKVSNVDETSVVNKNFLILYEMNNSIYAIIDKNSGAKSLLRKLFSFNGRGEVVQVNHNITSNMIVWLISMVYYSDASFTFNDKRLEIDSIIGFKGNTEDSLNKVSATGDGIMNILSTLSFLLESSSLKQVKIRLEYDVHQNLELKIDTNNTIEISIDKYLGSYSNDEDFPNYSPTDGHLIFLQYLLVYCELLPIIRQWFEESTDNPAPNENDQEANRYNHWGEDDYKEFLTRVSNDLMTKVQEKQDALN